MSNTLKDSIENIPTQSSKFKKWLIVIMLLSIGIFSFSVYKYFNRVGQPNNQIKSIDSENDSISITTIPSRSIESQDTNSWIVLDTKNPGSNEWPFTFKYPQYADWTANAYPSRVIFRCFTCGANDNINGITASSYFNFEEAQEYWNSKKIQNEEITLSGYRAWKLLELGTDNSTSTMGIAVLNSSNNKMYIMYLEFPNIKATKISDFPEPIPNIPATFLFE